MHTKQQHFDLVPLHHLIPLELIFDLLIPSLSLLILGTHSTPHLGYACCFGGKRSSEFPYGWNRQFRVAMGPKNQNCSLTEVSKSRKIGIITAFD